MPVTIHSRRGEITASNDGSRVKRTEERVDGFLSRMSHRRKEAIRKSMSRPLRVEMGRTAFIVACILADLVLLPIAVEYAIGRYWLVAAPLLLLPICYLQLRVHHQWFVSPFDEAANEGGPTQVDT